MRLLLWIFLAIFAVFVLPVIIYFIVLSRKTRKQLEESERIHAAIRKNNEDLDRIQREAQGLSAQIDSTLGAANATKAPAKKKSAATVTVNAAGVTHYTENLVSLLCENDSYYLSKSDLADIYFAGDKVPRYSLGPCTAAFVPEDDNEYDPKAVRIELDGVLVGYVKKGSTAKVRSWLKNNRITRIDVDARYGPYKVIDEDDDGRVTVSTGQYSYPSVQLHVHLTPQ